ncbi:phage DNA encapsidation protein, partial [Enterobacter hormaechei]
MKYYSTKKIDAKNATYNVIFGERSNGKTYALLKKGVLNWVKTKKQMAYVRRWKEDLTGRRAQQLFAGLVENGEISRLTNGEFAG